MIVLDFRRGRVFAAVVCDWCDKPIDDGRRGNFLGDDSGQPLVFVHKGDCDRKYCAAHGGREQWQGNEGLDLLPIYLAVSLRIDWDEAAERARSISSLDP